MTLGHAAVINTCQLSRARILITRPWGALQQSCEKQPKWSFCPLYLQPNARKNTFSPLNLKFRRDLPLRFQHGKKFIMNSLHTDLYEKFNFQTGVVQKPTQNEFQRVYYFRIKSCSTQRLPIHNCLDQRFELQLSVKHYT